MQLRRTLLSLGSLEVFEKVGQEGVYWMDLKSPVNQPYGPFKDLHTALSHYTGVVQERKTRRNGEASDIYTYFFEEGGDPYDAHATSAYDPTTPPIAPPPPPPGDLIQVDFINKRRIS